MLWMLRDSPSARRVRLENSGKLSCFSLFLSFSFSAQNQQQYQIVDLSPQQVQAMMQQQQGMGAMGMARQSFAPQQQMMQRPQQQMQVVDLSPQQVQQMMAQLMRIVAERSDAGTALDSVMAPPFRDVRSPARR